MTDEQKKRFEEILERAGIKVLNQEVGTAIEKAMTEAYNLALDDASRLDSPAGILIKATAVVKKGVILNMKIK